MGWKEVLEWVQTPAGKLALAGVGGITAALSGNPAQQNVGYTKQPAQLNAIRAAVEREGVLDPLRRPGSGGRRYFSNTQYADNEKTPAAQKVAIDEAAALGAWNRSNPYNNLLTPSNIDQITAWATRTGRDPKMILDDLRARVAAGTVTGQDSLRAAVGKSPAPAGIAQLQTPPAARPAAAAPPAPVQSGIASIEAPTSRNGMPIGVPTGTILKEGPWAGVGLSKGEDPVQAFMRVNPNINSLGKWAMLNQRGVTPDQYDKSMGAAPGTGQSEIAALRTQYGDKLGFRRGGKVARYAQGGIAGAAPSRYLAGPTDGMADEIPTSIDGKEPAALSHGEFVIPSRIVSAIGSGNSEAGAKELYAMMERIKQTVYGGKEQKQINPRAVLPA